MSGSLDHRWALAKESTFGTLVTTSRFYVRTDGCSHEWDPRRRSADGVQAGGLRAPLAARSYLPTGQGEIKLKVPVESKSFGLLLEACLGVLGVTTITGGAQMVATPGLTGNVRPSYSVQFVDVLNDAAGSELVTTYGGCTAKKWTLSQDNEDSLMLEVELDALTRSTAVAAATKSYTTGAIFDSYQAVTGLGGTLTVPTTTALATGLTAYPHVRSWKLECDAKISDDRWNINGGVRAQPVVGAPDWKWSAEVEHNDGVLVAASAAGTILPWYTTYTTSEVLGAGNSQLQVVVPALAVKTSPEPSPGEVSVLKVEGEIFNTGSAQDVYVAYRTLDTAA